MRTRSISIKSIVCSLKSDLRPLTSDLRPPPSARGFTLIELLVAMSLLMVIVLMLSNLFQQSTRSWGIGLRQAEIGLQARAAINLIEQDLSQAVASSNYFFSPIAEGSTLEFYMFSRNPTNDAAIEKVKYSVSGSILKRNDVDLVKPVDGFSVTPLYSVAADQAVLPDLVEISLTMSSSKNFSEVRVYVQGREYEEGGTTWVDTHRGN
jgi:prepilin-type N-terminal cleavage/methylation domain-containing protein